MNPDTNKFEQLSAEMEEQLDKVRDMEAIATGRLLRPDGTEVPKHWTQFAQGERVVIKDYTFEVAHIGESYIVFEPVGPVLVGQDDG